MLAAILEDDVLISEALRELLAGTGVEVRSYGSTDSAFAECAESPPDLLIADWCVPGDVSTARLVSYLHDVNPAMRVIFTSGQKTPELSRIIAGNNWAFFIPKPLSFESLLEAIKSGLEYPLGEISDSATA
jgi:DNA-binding NtrC family response regulator